MTYPSRKERRKLKAQQKKIKIKYGLVLFLLTLVNLFLVVTSNFELLSFALMGSLAVIIWLFFHHNKKLLITNYLLLCIGFFTFLEISFRYNFYQ